MAVVRQATRADSGREQVARIQRARILSAMVGVALEQGAAAVSVADAVERSGVSRRTFYELFADREECLIAALEGAIAKIEAVVTPAYESGGTWQERVRAGLTALLGLLDADPGLGRFVVVESLAAGPQALERRNRVLASLIGIVDEGREQAGASSESPPLTAEGVVGAVSSILYSRLLASAFSITGISSVAIPVGEDRDTLLALTGPLMSMIVLPYLGKAAANRELQRPAPAPRNATVTPNRGGYPFRDLGMRVTYRTLRVLDAAASNPDASNRQLGEAAGISDQGQISKLLSRLERAGLLVNRDGGYVRGEPNAWHLTDAGQAVVEAIAVNTNHYGSSAA